MGNMANSSPVVAGGIVSPAGSKRFVYGEEDYAEELDEFKPLTGLAEVRRLTKLDLFEVEEVFGTMLHPSLFFIHLYYFYSQSRFCAYSVLSV